MLRRWIRERIFLPLLLCFIGSGLTLIFADQRGDKIKASYSLRRDIYAEGRIISSVVHSSWSKVTKHSRREQIYIPVVQYEYAVRGQIYRNNQPRLNRSSERDFLSALEIADKYPEDSRVKVYYDPSQPSISTIDWDSRLIWGNGLGWFDFFIVLTAPIGLVLCFLFIAFDLFWPRPAKSGN